MPTSRSRLTGNSGAAASTSNTAAATSGPNRRTRRAGPDSVPSTVAALSTAVIVIAASSARPDQSLRAQDEHQRQRAEQDERGQVGQQRPADRLDLSDEQRSQI